MVTSDARTTIRGHVFVVKADVMTIKYDAWLFPTHPDFMLERSVREALGQKDPYLSGYVWTGCRAVAHDRAGEPLTVLGDVGRASPSGRQGIAAYIDELLLVIDAIAEVALEQLGKSKSEQPLRLALPQVAISEGGLSGVQGHTLKPLVDRFDHVAAEACVDFVLFAARLGKCWSLPRAWGYVRAVAYEDTISRIPNPIAGE